MFMHLLAKSVAQVLGGLRLACTSRASGRPTEEHAQGLYNDYTRAVSGKCPDGTAHTAQAGPGMLQLSGMLVSS